MKKLRQIVVLALAVMLFTVGCSSKPATQASSQAQASSSQAESQTRIVKDFNGDDVEISADAQKILTANTVATQLVLMMGGTDAVATVGEGFDYSDGSIWKKMYPGLDEVPMMTRDTLNVESALNINPDLVLCDVPDTVATLRDNGVPTAFSVLVSPETLMQSVNFLGDVLQGDAAAKAKTYCEYYQGLMDTLAEKTKDIKDEDKPVVYYARKPLATTGKNSMPDYWIAAAGGVNLGSKLGLEGSRAEITAEELIEADPDIIIAEQPRVYQEIMESEELSSLKAIKNNKVICNPSGAGAWSLATAESALQLLWAPTVIQPELFKDTDMKAEVKNFYNTYYGYDISDEEIDSILNPIPSK